MTFNQNSLLVTDNRLKVQNHFDLVILLRKLLLIELIRASTRGFQIDRWEGQIYIWIEFNHSLEISILVKKQFLILGMCVFNSRNKIVLARKDGSWFRNH